ncbi:MAG: hypothetical protein ACR2NC_02430 [Thermodesulfobacteriota bacterium]
MEFIRIVLRSLVFDKEIYLTAKSENSFYSYATLIVIIVSICNGIATYSLTTDASIFRGLIFSLFGWLLWTTIIYSFGVKLLGYNSGFGQLSRCLGLAYSPGIISILGIIKYFSFTVLSITAFWTVLTFIFGVKQALGCSALKAFLITIVSLIPYVLIRLAFFLF